MIHPLLAITALHGFRLLETARQRPPGLPKTSDLMLNGTGILTCFPFGVLELRYVLGPTNPRLTIIAEETWPLRRQGFSPCFAATITRIFVCERSTGLYSPASVRTATPSYEITFRYSVVSVVDLSPVNFQGPKPRLVSCYALFKG